MYTIREPLKDIRPGTRTLPQTLREAGYRTVSLGKVFHHEGDHPESWTREYRPPQQYSRGYVTPDARAAVDRRRTEVLAGGGQPKGRGPAYEIASDAQMAGHHDALIRDETILELEGSASSDDPFFLAVGFKKPHLPFTAPRWAWDLYDRDTLPLPRQRSFPDAAPRWHRNFGRQGAIWELANYTDIPPESPLPDDLARTLVHGYYACVTYVDRLVGEVLEALDRTGLTSSTTVVLWGDHGFKLADFGSFCKHTNYEVDTHAPLIIAGRGVPRGARTDALVEFVDVMPTVLEAAGVAEPTGLEGLSLSPLFSEPNRPWKAAAFSQYPRDGDMTGGLSLMGDALRSNRYRYVRWSDRYNGEVVAEELYDHRRPGLPTRNLAEDPEHVGGMDDARRLLNAGWKSVRDEVISR